MSTENARVVFMGSPEFALPSLEALVRSPRYHLALVVTQPDRGKGRGKALKPTPVKARALELGVPVREMSKANYADVVAAVAHARPNVIVVVAFGVILKDDLLNLPPRGCVNVHASLLPKYRGVSPIQAAILDGQRETGCTTMLMDAGIDTGSILLQESIPIGPDTTAGGLSERLSDLGAVLLIRTLDGMIDETLEPKAQDDALASYAGKIKKTDGEIDWSDDAAAVERRVRAMTPWPSAYTFHAGQRLIVVEATVGAGEGTGAHAGSIVSLEPFVVACGSGCLEIRRLKPEGKKEMTPAAYLAGRRLEPGEALG